MLVNFKKNNDSIEQFGGSDHMNITTAIEPMNVSSVVGQSV